MSVAQTCKRRRRQSKLDKRYKIKGAEKSKRRLSQVLEKQRAMQVRKTGKR